MTTERQLTGRLTSEPLGVVLDGPEDGSPVSQTPVDDGVAGQEVRHGGRVEISTCETEPEPCQNLNQNRSLTQNSVFSLCPQSQKEKLILHDETFSS